MAGSGFKKFLRLVVCKTSFYLFLYTAAMEEKLNVRMTALLNFAQTYPFMKTNVPHDKCLGKSWNIVKI